MRKYFLPALLLFFTIPSYAETPDIRVGVLKWGTVNWELDTVQRQQLDQQNGFNLDVLGLGGKNATAVALQGGEVNAIVTDWIWVSRQRNSGQQYQFFPYSNAVGGMIVRNDSGITSLADLEGKRLGIAGGPVDKTWLLYRAYAQKMLDKDLKHLVEMQFGAPALLNELLLKCYLDAVITFWHYQSRLLSAGHQRLLDVPQIRAAFGVETAVPLLGWVFSQQWAEDHPEQVTSLLNASYQAKALLRSDDTAWATLDPRLR